MLCVDVDDLDKNYFPEVPMPPPEPWETAKDEILALLKSETADLKGELKDAAESFLQDQAVQIAQETYRANFGTDDEKEIAKSNLRHLRGQRTAEIKRLQVAATERAENFLGKVLSVAQGLAEKLIPVVLEKYAGKII